ncbi:hypothetical protein GCM10022392_09840 [Mucilaginibacter panaciglaebae]|uniref:Uncharacterized protein n=1 Tax=Mucilaginibacter panaciglaebae TaxID=502331 RepID=A0ABP7WJG3_9SPHI
MAHIAFALAAIPIGLFNINLIFDRINKVLNPILSYVRFGKNCERQVRISCRFRGSRTVIYLK